MPETTKRLRGIILTVTEQCNLRCDYCYVPVDRGNAMTDAVADRAIDWFLDHAAESGTIGLSFFGGEPFLASQQMRRSVRRLRDGLTADRRVRVVTPTNGLAMSDNDLAWCRERDIEIAISIDGNGHSDDRSDNASSHRRLVDGRNVMTAIAGKVPLILRKLPPGAAMARMTVTPANVGNLCASVRALAGVGFERIVYIPDYDSCWDEPAISRWQREHERLATWMIAARSAGQRLPELPAWSAIAHRLRQGTARRPCGAGTEQVTVTPDGSLYPCYRFAYAKDGKEWRLGDVHSGIERTDRVERLSAVHSRADGRCGSCPAADGCTHFCPALGFIATGAIEGVPEIVCRLIAAQVESVRRLIAAAPVAHSKPARPWAKAAAVAAAVSAMAACGSNAGTSNATDAAPDVSDSAVQITLPPDAATIDADRVDSDHVDGEDISVPVGGLCY